MDNETYKLIVLSYIPYGIQVQYEGILNGKEKTAYKREYDAKLEKMWNLATPPTYNPPTDVVGLKLGLIKKVSFWKNYTNLEVGTKTHGLKRFTLNLNTEPKFKLVLQPLSDFCVKITLGEVKTKLSCTHEDVEEIWHLYNYPTSINQVSNKVIQLLCKNHIDYAELIPKGLAIDINTLTK